MPARVVSLLPSATELLFAAGAGELLVGRSHECDFPASVASVPVVTSQRIRATEPAKIDAEVRAALAEPGASLYDLDEAAIRALRPDVILTQDLCRVCSIDLERVRKLASTLEHPPKVVSLNPHTVEDVLDDLLRVGEAVDARERAMSEVVRLRERLFAAGEHVNPFNDGPHVALLEWTDPLYVGGHWSVQLIERAGGFHMLNATQVEPGQGAGAGPQHGERKAGPSVRVPEEIFVASKPEWIIIAPCGLTLDAARAAAAELARKPWWRDLPAVRAGRVAVVDGNQMFNRPGPRIVDAFEWLVGWLQEKPEVMPRGFPWAG
jgi:iron complex transport system substrate-binding protein